MRIDLHLHSWHSDGLLPPAHVMQNAQAAGLALVALTDHDTTAGLAEAAAEASRLGLDFVGGIEMTTSLGGIHEDVHLLGYDMDPAHPAFAGACADCRRLLRERLAAMIEALRQRHGFDVTLDEVDAASPHTDVLDRPHLARVLVTRGLVPSFKQTFEQHLGQEGDCFVPLEGVSTLRAIEVIHEAGGLAVLAHPKYYHQPEGATVENIAALVEAGLDGLEVHHAAHSPEEVARFRAVAKHHRLLITGGSDCHGGHLPDGVRLIDRCVVPEDVAENFVRLRRARPGAN